VLIFGLGQLLLQAVDLLGLLFEARVEALVNLLDFCVLLKQKRVLLVGLVQNCLRVEKLALQG